MHQHYATLRRATTGRNVLGWLALGFLFGFGYFWWQVWQPIFAPPGLISQQATVCVIISAVYTLVLPLLLSMAVPNSPAGHLLQKQTWAVPGQVMVVCLATMLVFVAVRVFMLWLTAQPGIRETGMFYPALLAMVAGGICVPAISWAVMTPEQLIALYEQARIVKQLEYQAQLEDLKQKAMHARFSAIINSDMSAMTIERFGQHVEEMTTLLATGARQEAQRYRALAHTFRQIYGVELATADDEHAADRDVLDQYRHVYRLLSNAADNYVQTADVGQQIIDVTPHEDTRSQSIETPIEHRSAGAETLLAHVNTRSPSFKTHGEDVRHDPAVSDTAGQVYDAIARTLPAVFTAANVSDAMGYQDKRSGQRIIRAWIDADMAREIERRPGRYELTERGGRA